MEATATAATAAVGEGARTWRRRRHDRERAIDTARRGEARQQWARRSQLTPKKNDEKYIPRLHRCREGAGAGSARTGTAKARVWRKRGRERRRGESAAGVRARQGEEAATARWGEGARRRRGRRYGRTARKKKKRISNERKRIERKTYHGGKGRCRHGEGTWERGRAAGKMLRMQERARRDGDWCC